jgi:cell division protein FtsL
MKALTTANLVALFIALVLTAGEVLIIQYDAHQRVVRYQAETSASAERG